MPNPWMMLKATVPYRVYWVIFFASLLAFLGETLQVRNHHGQQLQDNGGADVRHDAQREHGQPFKGASGEHVENIQQRSLGPIKKGRQRDGIDPWRGYVYTHAVYRQQREGVQHPIF